MNLAEVMQLCSLGMRSGRIEYKLRAEQGLVFCKNGQVIHAEFRSRIDQDAVIDMLLQEGSEADFFEEDVSNIEHTTSLSCTHLLLESTRILDETRYQRSHASAATKKIYRFTQLIEEGEPLVFDVTQDGQQLGRHEDNAILIPHHTISRHHCAFHLKDGKIYVSDLGSTNGTYIDDTLAQDTPLNNGEVIRLGELFFRFESMENTALNALPSQKIQHSPLHQTTLIPTPFRPRHSA